MKNYLYGIFAIAFLAFTACTNEELPTPGTGPDTPVEHKSGEILVKFSPYVSEILDKAAAATRSGGPATRSGILSVDEVLDIVGGYQIERVFPVDGRNEERTRESELHLWYVVRFGDDYSAEEVAEKLSALGEVQHVNLNRTIRRAARRRCPSPARPSPPCSVRPVPPGIRAIPSTTSCCRCSGT